MTSEVDVITGRGTIKVVLVAVAVGALVASCFKLPAPGYQKGLTRSALNSELDGFHLTPGAAVLDERYSGTDRCRIYQWLQFRCEDVNRLGRTVRVPMEIGQLCDRLSTGEVGLGRPPDWYQPDASGSCSFSWDVSDKTTISGGAVSRSTPQGDWSDLQLYAVSS